MSLLLTLIASGAQAANCPPNSCCRDDSAQGAPAACVGNPINLVSGNKYQMEVDMPALPGVLGLELVRHYNSENSRILPGGADGKGRNDNIGVLGRGWRLGYDRQIIWPGEGTRQGELMTLVEGDGRRLLFTRSLRDTLVYEGRGEAAGQIIRVRPAQERARLPAHVGWRYEWLARGGIGGGLREHFDAKGWMVARMAPTGEMLAIRRNTIGWPLTVTDPQGRQLVLHYMSNQERAANRKLPDSQHIFSGVQHIDTPVGRFSYRYGGHDAPLDAKNAQVQPMNVAANLRAVVQPGQITRHYHHEDLRWPTLLSGISVQAVSTVAQRQAPSQRIVTWLYDNQGRAVLSVHGAPARLQRNAQGQLIQPARLVAGTGIDQVFISWPKTNEAQLINALGQRTHYQMANIAGQLRVVESRGPGCPSCTPGNTRWRYNEAGQVLEQTRITPQGQPIEGLRWQYDVTGRMVAEQAVRYHTRTGKPVEQVVNLAQYANAYRNDKDHQGREVLSSVAPQIITRPSVVPGKQQEIHIRYNDRGQPLAVTHKGWRPATEAGQLPQAIERSTRYHYQLVNGRSVLTQVDGPLPNANNGSQSSPQGSDITRYTWDARGSYVVAVDAPQGQSRITYDAAGRVASVSSERGATHWTYNGQQLAQVEQSQPGWPAQKQTYAYDAHGRMTEQTGQTKRVYDRAGRLLWQASAMGVLETNQWDALGQLTQTKRLTNAITQENNFAYDEQGRIIQLSDNQGRVTHIAYNELGQPTWIADQSGRVISATTDEPARTARPQQWVDDFGRVVATRSPDHGLRTQQYDAANRLVAMHDALGNRAQYQYDARGRIVKQTVESSSQTDAEAGAPIQTTWRYEGDHLVALTHPTQIEQYSYDERGLRTSKTITRKTTEGGDLIAITCYAYNEQGQLMGTSLPDGSWITYTRNGQGQVVALKRSPIHPQHLRWLAWLLPEQTIAQDFERDMVGLRSYTHGNGLQTRYQRSQAGVLARVHVSKPMAALSKAEQAKAADRLLQMLGMQAAYAQSTTQNASKIQAADPLATLGALGIKPDPQALIDHRYLWDTRGNLLYTRSGAKQNQVNTYAYDEASRLVVSVASEGEPEALKERSVNRYFYHASKRVLQQQNASAQSDIHTNTLRVNHREGTHQWAGVTQTDTFAGADYDAAGQPTRLAQRRFKWDAFGRLAQVSNDAGQSIVRYAYNHRGERIRKTVNKEDTAYLYDDSRQLQAELNSKKLITRQYIYLADMPLAVVDTPEGASLDEPRSGLGEFLHELIQVISAVFTNQGDIAYLHTNHLGAVEVATNIQGQVIWQVAYEPFGAARVQTHGAPNAFALNMRLPGQYEDAETGLYYNDHRYYDPQRGEYISPDPLGNPNGSNSYAYVAYNPLNAIDPLGLILFAFDGTGNDESLDDPAMNANGISNVVQFRELYRDGQARYVSGVGTVHEDIKYGDIIPANYADGTMIDWLTPNTPLYYNDMGGNYSGPARIDRMVRYFDEEAKATPNNQIMNVDIIGFSRGAAQARDFANRIADRTFDGVYRYAEVENGKTVMRCQQVNLRFIGLWDTVLSTNNSGYDYKLQIPDEFKHVAHAVALNEYRSGGTGMLGDAANTTGAWDLRNHQNYNQHMGGFPLVSIGLDNGAAGKVRIERGFIGAHADIGGGYKATENQLSTVALSWMVAQAEIAGVNFDLSRMPNIPNTPTVLHDQSNAIRVGDPVKSPTIPRMLLDADVEDRMVIGSTLGSTQRSMTFLQPSGSKSLTNVQTHQFINYFERNSRNWLSHPSSEPLGPRSSDVAGLLLWSAKRGALNVYAKSDDGNLSPSLDPTNLGNKTGTVNMSTYMQWLRKNGYCFTGDGCDKPS